MACREEPFNCPESNQEMETTKKKRQRRRKAAGGGVGDGCLKKRRLSEEQAWFLEKSFREERKLESARKTRLAGEAGLDPKQVAVWFQNRRARWRSKSVEEEYAGLKAAHEAAVLDNGLLEAQILKLKEQLSAAHMEISKLSCDGGFGSSGDGEVISTASTSVSVEASHCEPKFCDNHEHLIDLEYANMWVDYNTWNPYGLDDIYPSFVF